MPWREWFPKRGSVAQSSAAVGARAILQLPAFDRAQSGYKTREARAALGLRLWKQHAVSLSLRFGLRSRLRFGREREVRSNRKCTRVEKPEVIGNALPAQKPEAQAEGMRVVACKRPAVRLVGAANVCHQNVDLGLPCPTASNKPHGRTPRDRLTTCPLACPSRVADAAWQRRHGRTRANSRPPPAPPR